MKNNGFKFRAWYKNPDGKFEMIYNVQATYDYACCGVGSAYHRDFQEVLDDKDAVVERCTGFRDKKGKLIYAGDVVMVVLDGMFECGRTFEVVDCVTRWQIRDLADSLYYDLDIGSIFEIIGNIHEMEVEK